MYRYERQMSDQERALLEAALQVRSIVTFRTSFPWIFAWTVLGAGCAYLGWHLHPAWVLGSLIFALFLWLKVAGDIRWAGYQRETRREHFPKLRQILADGRVVVTRVEASGVVELLEAEDEGPTYFFAVGGGKILFLHGQHIVPARETDPWPSTGFEIVESKLHDEWLGIFPFGGRLDPVESIEPSTFEYNHLPTEPTFEGSLATLREDLSRQAARGGA
jgi:hypothetical protein